MRMVKAIGVVLSGLFAKDLPDLVGRDLDVSNEGVAESGR